MKIKIISKLNKKQQKELYKLYKKEWWSKNRKEKDIKKMLENSDIIAAVINKEKKLIAFSRVLSDFVYKADIFDVIVSKKYRGKKLGSLLIENILHHPKLKNVKSFNLQCKKDMKNFYKKFGFKEEKKLIFMSKKD